MFIVLIIYKAIGAINTPVVSASEEHGGIKLSMPRAKGETWEEAGVFKASLPMHCCYAAIESRPLNRQK